MVGLVVTTFGDDGDVAELLAQVRSLQVGDIRKDVYRMR
jgi:hypothetical protein